MEINDIFKNAKKKLHKRQSKTNRRLDTKEAEVSVLKKEKTKKKGYNNTPKTINEEDSGESKYTNKKMLKRKYIDGLPIYTLEELNVGKGGDTEECPIWCNCCF